MFKLVLCIFTCLNVSDGESVLGKGLWSLISVSECTDAGLRKETFKCEVNKHKLNRTQDGISAHITITEEITESYGIYIDICKFVEGGCKPYQVISDNVAKFFNKYAEENFVTVLKMANFNNYDFPLPKGEYDLKDYMVNYCNLPSNCVYGKYEALYYFVSNLQRVSCMKVVVECNTCEDDDSCCDRDEK